MRLRDGIRWEIIGMALVGLVVVASFAIAAWALRSRSDQINDVLFEQCVQNEAQDAVIVSILRTIPPDRRSQVIVDAINTLEPPDEKDCQPPEGTQP